METTSYTHLRLTAAPGHKLTQAAEVSPISRIVCECVYLSPTDSPDNWREIPDSEAAEYSAAHERAKAEAKAAAEAEIAGQRQ